MNVSEVVKNWKNNIILLLILTVLGLVCAYCAGRFFSAWHEHSQSFKSMIAAREKYNRFIVGNKEFPSQKLIKQYQEHAIEVSDLYKKIHQILVVQNKKVKKDIPALDFKQHLLSTLQEYREKSENRGIQIPPDLGFREFMGDKIPQQKTVDLLALQLEIITSIMDCFFNAGVQRVDTVIKRNYIKDLRFKRRVPLNFTFKSEMKGLNAFLDMLQAKNEVIIVDNINIVAIPLDKFREENNLCHLLEVTIDLSYVELK